MMLRPVQLISRATSVVTLRIALATDDRRSLRSRIRHRLALHNLLDDRSDVPAQSWHPSPGDMNPGGPPSAGASATFISTGIHRPRDSGDSRLMPPSLKIPGLSETPPLANCHHRRRGCPIANRYRAGVDRQSSRDRDRLARARGRLANKMANQKNGASPSARLASKDTASSASSRLPSPRNLSVTAAVLLDRSQPKIEKNRHSRRFPADLM